MLPRGPQGMLASTPNILASGKTQTNLRTASSGTGLPVRSYTVPMPVVIAYSE